MVLGVRDSRFFCFVVLLYVDANCTVKNGFENCGSCCFFYHIPGSMQEDKSTDTPGKGTYFFQLHIMGKLSHNTT